MKRTTKPLTAIQARAWGLVSTTGDAADEARRGASLLTLLMADRIDIYERMRSNKTPDTRETLEMRLRVNEQHIATVNFFIATARQKVALLEKQKPRDAREWQYRFFASHVRQMRYTDPLPEPKLKEIREGLMPCDIHTMIEVRFKGADGWNAVSQAPLFVPQDYTLFAYLAGVRAHDGIEPLVKPRGFPAAKTERISADTQDEFGRWADFSHDASWLTPQEWIAACVTARLKSGVSCVEALAIGNHAKTLAESEKYDAARIVFWFNS